MKSFVLIALVLGLFGCDKPATSAVTFTREGGLAFTSTRLTIDAAGHAKVTVEGSATPTQKRFTLTMAQRDELATLIDAARDADSPSVRGGCADCFTYTIKADGLSVSYDDAASVPGETSALTAALSKLAG